jgi:sulfite dehydrogenase (quinone) subunit SoeA
MGKLSSMSRRAFLQLSAATAGIAAVGELTSGNHALAQTGDSDAGEVKRVRTCCRGCGKCECGVWVTVKNGRAIKIEGDESAYQSNGNCCAKSQASLQAAYHPDRLHYPLKRTNPKGEDPGWVRISWDEALETCHSKMKEVQDRYGGEAIIGMMGTSRLWAMATPPLVGMYGSKNSITAAQICKGIRRDAGALTIENGVFFFETVAFPRVYVQWGTQPSMSNYDDSCRTIAETVARADTYIVVDPRLTNEGKDADIHLALRPGTDGAMALGWTHQVMKNGWEDHTFCTRWSNAPFLYCEDLGLEDNPFFTGKYTKGGGLSVKTRLLRECDLVEGGSKSRFMVWDSLNGRLTYFDADESIGRWEGEEAIHKPTTFTDYVRPSDKFGMHDSGDVSGRIPDPTTFENEIEPELWYEGEVTLKDGRKVKVKSVWKKYWDDVVEKYTPEYTAKICDVEPELIEKAVEAWAGKRFDPRFANGGIHFQLAPEQCGNSLQNFRALTILSAIVGGYDCPGGNRGMTRAPLSCGGLGSPYSWADWTMGTDPGTFVETFTKNANECSAVDYPLTRWTSRDDARCIWDAAMTGNPYPIKGGVCCAGDFMNQCNSTYAWNAIKQMDFFVDIDLWHHPTSELADIKLPAQHWMEIPGFARMSQGASGGMGANQHCIEAPGECRFEVDICNDWFKVAGKPFLKSDTGEYWGETERYLDWQVEGTGKTWHQYITEFQEKGWWRAKEEYPERWGTYKRYETGGLRQPDSMSYAMEEGDGMPGTVLPTMKVEIWSTVMETYLSPELGYLPEKVKDTPISAICLPEYKEPPLSPVSRPDLTEEYPFNMTTGRRIPVYFHSEHRQLPWCRELWPVPRCEMNPADAEKLGVKQGDWIWIESKDGKIRETVDIFPGIKPGVINAEHTWWYPELSAPNHGWNLSCINVLVDKDAQDPWTGSSQLRAYPVKVYKATAENSPFGNPCPCDEDGTPIISDSNDKRLKEWLPTYEGRD